MPETKIKTKDKKPNRYRIPSQTLDMFYSSYLIDIGRGYYCRRVKDNRSM